MSLAAPVDWNMLPSRDRDPSGDWAGPTSGFAENASAIYNSQKRVNSQFGLTEMYHEELQKRDDAIFKLTGKRFGVYQTTPEFSDQYKRNASKFDVVKGRDPLSPATGALMRAYEKAVENEKQIDELRKQYPEIKSRDDIFGDISKRRAEIEGKAAEVSSRAGLSGMFGGFIGGMAGSMTTNSPVNLATLPVGGFGATPIKRVATEAVTQMAMAGVDQAFVAKEYGRMGETLPSSQIAQNVIFAGAAGAVFQGAAEGAGAILSRLSKKAELADSDSKDSAAQLAKELVEAQTTEQRAAILQRANPDDLLAINEIVNPAQSTAQKGAVQAAEVESFVAAENPIKLEEIGAQKMHEEILQSIENAVEADLPLPQSPVAVSALTLDAYKKVPVETFKVADLDIDAQAMQFKSGGDDSGVTDRLRGVVQWNDYLAGVVSVWERNDGKFIVADGHQRVGLAKRIMASDPAQDISIPAYVFKEKNGVTQEQVRTLAALRNISEGTGTAADAANVFKNLPDATKQVYDSLPPNSAVVKQGRDLASLDNEAYLMVVNGVVDEKIGAVVGRLERNAEKQRSLMALMASEEPDTIFQAEQIVRQAQQAGFDVSEQQTLFGTETVTESLFKDKAKVLERSLALIKSDVKTFQNLIKKGERIAEAGNKLNQTANKAILEDSGAILNAVQRLAYRKGPVADLLTEAAREAKGNGKYKQNAERFVDAIRSRLDDGGVSGLLDPTERNISDAIKEVTRRIESEQIAQTIETSKALYDDQPKNIDSMFQDIQSMRDAQMPKASSSADGAEGAAAISPKSARVEGSQSLASASNSTTRKPPSDFFSTAKKMPSILTGGNANLGIESPVSSIKVYHVANKTATLIKKAKEYEKPLMEWLQGQAESVRGAEFVGARVKLPDTVGKKMTKRKKGPNQVADYLGARLVVDSMDALDEMVAKLSGEARVLEVDDFIRTPRDTTSYRAVHMQLEARDGFSYEVQIIPRDIMNVYEKTRPYYAKWKEVEIDAVSEKAYLKDKAKADKLFNKAWRDFQERDLREKAITAFDLEEEVPVAIEFDSMGNETIKTARMGDLLADIESHQSLFENMTKCSI